MNPPAWSVNQRQQQVLTALQGEADGMTTKEISALFGGNRDIARNVTDSLYTRRLIGRQLHLRSMPGPQRWFIESGGKK